MGFLGMLRPHTFSQLGPYSFTFVTADGSILRCRRNAVSLREFMSGLLLSKNLVGFYIDFESKTMTNGRAYYPKLSQVSEPYCDLCPLEEVRYLAAKDWVHKRFLHKLGRGKALREYLQELASSKTPVSAYALRIGGRTWNITQGLDRQFVDYLGTC